MAAPNGILGAQGSSEAGPSSGLSLAQQAALASGSSTDLPHAAALDHDNVYLSPLKAPTFDIDEFLVSRVPAATLAGITTELEQYNERLQVELGDVVDRDFRGFVNLGAALKAEGPRIARLDWKVPRKQLDVAADGDVTVDRTALTLDHRPDSLDAHYDAGSNLGLERVRSELVSVRDDLRSAEEGIRATMTGRDVCEKGQEDLKVLLSYDDSLCRLEALLLPGKALKQHNASEAPMRSHDPSGQGAGYWAMFAEADNDHDGSGSEASFTDSSSDEGGAILNGINGKLQASSPTLSRRSIPRRSSLPASVRTRRSNSGAKELEAFDDKLDMEASSADADLPALIARVSSEYAAMTFLRRRAAALGFHDFLRAQETRINNVCIAIRVRLVKLIAALTSFNGSSLLVGRPLDTTKSTITRASMPVAEITDLERWSRVGDQASKHAEQSAWLQLAFAMWNAVQPLDSPLPTSSASAEIEEVIRGTLVTPFARRAITPRALEKGPDSNASNVEGPTGLINATDITQRTKGDGSALIELYNTILAFIEAHTSEISRCAEAAAMRGGGEDAEKSDFCDVYVHCIWQGLITEIMEQLGGQLFFVGRPSDFQRSYIISMHFVEAVERLAPSQRARDALRQDHSYLTFKKRWQLPVYFQMRLRDTVSKLEARLAQSNGEFGQFSASKGNVTRQLPLTAAAQACAETFARPWMRGQHIPELTARQWRLSLQIATRYRSFIRSQLPSDILSKDKNPGVAGFRPGTAGNSGSLSPARVSTPVGRDGMNEEDAITPCTAFAVDILWLEARLSTILGETILPTVLQSTTRATAEADSIMEHLKGSLREATSLREEIVPLLRARATSVLKLQCAEPLRLVRSLSSQYRTAAGSSGPAKTTATTALEPSYFVAQFMRPVRQFLGVPESMSRSRSSTDAQAASSPITLSALLPTSVRQNWLSDVIEDFVARYAASLKTMNKNFESLQRLKRVNATSTSTGDDESRAMHAQMRADVEALDIEVQGFASVDTRVATDTPAWSRLRQAANGTLDE